MLPAELWPSLAAIITAAGTTLAAWWALRGQSSTAKMTADATTYTAWLEHLYEQVGEQSGELEALRKELQTARHELHTLDSAFRIFRVQLRAWVTAKNLLAQWIADTGEDL